MTRKTTSTRAPERADDTDTTGAGAPVIHRTLDYPPIWLAGFIGLAWGGRGIGPLPAMPLVGGALIALGVALMLAALIEMRRHRTTVIPHNTPSALVTTGVFRRSRNPIYLADAFTLVGFSLLCGSLIGMVSVAAFLAIITRRFISVEERKLAAEFGTEFAVWSKGTRRWL